MNDLVRNNPEYRMRLHRRLQQWVIDVTLHRLEEAVQVHSDTDYLRASGVFWFLYGNPSILVDLAETLIGQKHYAATKDPTKPDAIYILAERITDYLFTCGTGEAALRLVLELPGRRNGGGWARSAAATAIDKVIRQFVGKGIELTNTRTVEDDGAARG